MKRDKLNYFRQRRILKLSDDLKNEGIGEFIDVLFSMTNILNARSI
jgi:hypothetical protein